MKKRRKSELASLVFLVTGLVVMVFGDALLTPSGASKGDRNPAMGHGEAFRLTGVAHARGSGSIPRAVPPRGAPIDGAITPSENAEPVGPPKSLAPGERDIPDEAFEALEQADSKGLDSGKNLTFEKTANGDFYKLTFRKLASFEYVHPDPELLKKSETPFAVLGDQIPAVVRRLNGQPAIVVGFMVPFEMAKDGSIISFAVTQNQAYCCYGVAPEINEWILVEASPELEVSYDPVSPIAVSGIFEVGEEIEEGFVLSIYRMKADKVTDASAIARKSLLRP